MKIKTSLRITLLITVMFFSPFLWRGAGGEAFAQNTRIWASYYGGINNEYATSVSTDASGNVYLAGHTDSPSGITFGGFQNTYGGGQNDAFLVKFDAAGNRLWATYYGGTGSDVAKSVTTDSFGNVYLAGYTDSSFVGIASGGFQNTHGGGIGDAFLVKFDATGNRLWATYYGGAGNENGYCVTTDNSGNVYLAGNTDSPTNIASGGFQNIISGQYDAFLVKFDAITGNRIWATYYGELADETGWSVVTDVLNNVYLAGLTGSSSGIASSGSQNIYGGGNDAFLVKLDATGTRLWATYYGGSNTDYAQSVTTDTSGNVYLAGRTKSTIGIASGGFQNIFGGGAYDAFLVKFDTAGNRLWATYYGGGQSDYALSVATDVMGNVYLSGDTYSSGSAIASSGFQNNLSISALVDENEFVAMFDINGNRLCATYYGQGHDEDGRIALDNSGNVYLVGYTQSTSGMASGGFQNTFGGGTIDSYLVKFTSCGTILLTATATSTNINCNGSCTGAATVTSIGGSGSYTYLWNSTPTQTTQTATNLCAGNYTVTVTDGASNTATATVTITQPAAITATQNPSICSGNTYTLPGGTTVNVSGTYNDTLTTVNGCDSIITTNLTVNPLPTVTITGSNSICSGASTTLTANGAISYTWSTSTTTNTISVSPTTGTTYSVIATDVNGCINSASQNIIVNSTPLANAGPNQIICSGQTATLTGSGGTTYLWSTSETTNNISVSPVTTGIYTLTAYNGPCSNADTVTVFVNPSPVIILSSDVTISQGASTILTATGGGTYNWSPATYLSCATCANTTATPLFTTQYCVDVTTNGCTTNKCLNVTVDIQCNELFVPNGFSPNGDGKNDVLEVYVNKTCVTDFSFLIFDRWGEKVFESNDINTSWDGTYKGKALDNAAFVYYLNLTLINTDAPIIKKGNVSIIK